HPRRLRHGRGRAVGCLHLRRRAPGGEGQGQEGQEARRGRRRRRVGVGRRGRRWSALRGRRRVGAQRRVPRGARGTGRSTRVTMRARRGGLPTGIVRLACVAALVAALSGCARENVTEVVVRSVQVEPSQITVVAGSSVEFEAIVADDGGGSVTGADVEWSSDAPHVAFVDADGIARAVSDGTATIEATFRDVTGAAKLTVLPASTIELVPASVDVYGGVDGENPAAAQVAVGNRGGGPLEGLRTEVQY